MRLVLIGITAVGWVASAGVEFNRDIRPILSDRCYTCHGPEQAQRKSKLRLDTEAGAKADLGGHFAIVPGDAGQERINPAHLEHDQAKRMPPAWAGAARLTDREIDLLTRWVAQGAAWQKHWSFIPPERPALPEVKDTALAAQSDRLFSCWRAWSGKGSQPSPEADRADADPPRLARSDRPAADARGSRRVRAATHRRTPMRRWSTGCSPRRATASAWPRAGSMRARYADTNGYQTDGERVMWRWRDWVIDAFNRNMPFDRFTVEQIAGDMLPNATLAQKIATGFNRNHRGNAEGGIIPEEYAVEYVVDRVETTSTVWLGLTLGCARCHNHKYDPFTQKEFYQVFAYFNNVPERGKAYQVRQLAAGRCRRPRRSSRRVLAALDTERAAAHSAPAQLEPEIAKAQREWEQHLGGKPPSTGPVRATSPSTCRWPATCTATSCTIRRDRKNTRT